MTSFFVVGHFQIKISNKCNDSTLQDGKHGLQILLITDDGDEDEEDEDEGDREVSKKN